MVEKWGLENVGMYTFTFSEDIDFKEASRRWNSFNTHVLSRRYDGDWIKVLELTKRGRPHFHVILHVVGIRIGAVITRLATKRDKFGEGIKWRWIATGPRDSVLWSERRFYAEVLSEYGFGSWNDISPILSTAEAAASYAAKYVSKAFKNRPYSLKGARLVSFGRGVKPGTTNFSSIGGRAGLFREMVGMYCRKHGLEWEDLPTECEILYAKPNGKYIGHRWAYFMRADFQRVWDKFALDQPF